jgi:DNA-binding HxlR family transcriptional regulator
VPVQDIARSPASPRASSDVATQVHDEACPVREVLDRVAGKWSILIIISAARGPVRFTELERSIEGISRRMLTLTLRNLERDGLLTRTAYPTVPPKVEYRLTTIAHELHHSLLSLTEWAQRHRATISEARVAYDQGLSESQTSGSR